MIVTIDGPVAAGKTSCARMVSERLGFTLLDTGAIYRSVALVATQAGVDWQSASAVCEIAERLAIDFRFADGSHRVFIEGREVTASIRTPRISQGASVVSAHPSVRKALLGLQRRYSDRADIVAEGRDTGTVVFPDADHKFFLDADPEVRARRRLAELRDSGFVTDLESVVKELRERDRRDSRRAVAPLVAAPDAVRIDSSDSTLEEVLAVILGHLAPREIESPS